MKVDIKNVLVDASYIKVEAMVRYWENGTINGVKDEDGTITPFREGDLWCPVINIDTGVVLNWPVDMTASFHYKICDSGVYYLLDSKMEVVASILDNYVPSGLCHGDTGIRDYIIFNVNKDGKIIDYQAYIDCDDWNDED